MKRGEAPGGEAGLSYGRIPHLSHEEMVDLFTQLGQGGGQRVRDRLIRGNMRLVMSMARTYHRPGAGSVSFEDLVQEGSVGLIRAVDRFDVSRGHRFSTYASWWIKQALNEAVTAKRRMIRLPSHAHRLQRRLFDARAAYQETFKTPPTLEELAELTGASVDVVRATLNSGLPVGSIDEPREGQGEGSAGRTHGGSLRVLPDTAASPYDRVLAGEVQSAVARALDSLSPRENIIIRLRLGLVQDAQSPDRYPVSQEEVDGLEAGLPLT